MRRSPASEMRTYWGRPVPGFGDPDAKILILGLAPAAHGGNRTGRVFTGDASGDFLWPALHRAGLADRPVSRRADDGLTLSEVYIAAAVRCAPPANKPTIEERDTCAPFLVRELGLLASVRVVLALGRVRVGRGAARAGRFGPRAGERAKTKVRPRRGGVSRAVRARRVVPPVAAEHVHRPTDASDVRRGCSASS